jgi:bacteriorhodopsin
MKLYNYLNTYQTFSNTLYLSIIVQILTGIIEIGTLFVKVQEKFILIRQLLILELLVQVVEGLFYLWLALNIKTVTNVTPKRYMDWFITTPTMLVTLICYLIYLQTRNINKDIDNKESNNKESDNLTFFKIISENKENISLVLFLNALMLVFGYLGESKIISTIYGVSLGFIPFILYYYIIYNDYARYSEQGLTIFYYFLVIWTIYGLAAFLPYYIKNTFYNILDLFAKNFFGIFLSYIILFNKY